jgi:hypothetical protein
VSRSGFHKVAFRELSQKAAHWNALSRAFELEAGAVSFYAIDALSHRFWADSFPGDFDDDEAPAVEPGYAEAIPAAYAGFDRALGEIVAALPQESAVIVASDHGFEARAGWRVRSYARGALAGPARRVATLMLEGVRLATLRVRPRPLLGAGAARADLLRLRGRGRQPLFDVVRLDAAARPGHGAAAQPCRAVWRWVARLAFSVGFSDDNAWLVARPNDAALESVWPDGQVELAGRQRPAREVVFGDGFSGSHDPVAVFVAAGGPLRHDAERGRLSVLDVAPLYAYLAGAAIPDDLPGVLPLPWLEPAALAQQPPRRVPAASLARLPEPTAPTIPDAALLEQLRAMGYVE